MAAARPSRPLCPLQLLSVSSPLREKALLHACGQTQPVSASHASVLYLWFWSPGSQAGVLGAGWESPAASAGSPPSLAEPQESQSEMYTHTSPKEKGGGGHRPRFWTPDT